MTNYLQPFLQKTFVYALNIGLLSFFFRTFALDFVTIFMLLGQIIIFLYPNITSFFRKTLIFNCKTIEFRNNQTIISPTFYLLLFSKQIWIKNSLSKPTDAK